MAAARVLVRVEDGGFADDLLPDLAPEDGADRGLAWHLVLGVLQRRATLDAALRPFCRIPLPELDPGVRAVLRLGAYEQLIGRAPAHAAVSQAVEVARAVGGGRASGMVNAILRRVKPPAELSRAESLDHPDWLVARWTARYGPEATDAWCRANNTPPPRVLVCREDAAEVARALDEAGHATTPARAQGVEVPGALRLTEPRGRVEELPGYESGAWWVQDAASAWMTDLVPASATTVLDACAAPGGKTFRLAARGAEVTSVDRSEHRLDRLRGSLERLRLKGRVVAHDWFDGPLPEAGPFDAVLVDAPCTALGTVRRRPEIRWRRGPLDPATAAETQAAVLTAAATHVRQGGHLVYVVCSPEPEEGPELVASWLADHPEFTEVARRATAPPSDDEDAFFGVQLERA